MEVWLIADSLPTKRSPVDRRSGAGQGKSAGILTAKLSVANRVAMGLIFTTASLFEVIFCRKKNCPVKIGPRNDSFLEIQGSKYKI